MGCLLSKEEEAKGSALSLTNIPAAVDADADVSNNDVTSTQHTSGNGTKKITTIGRTERVMHRRERETENNKKRKDDHDHDNDRDAAMKAVEREKRGESNGIGISINIGLSMSSSEHSTRKSHSIRSATSPSLSSSARSRTSIASTSTGTTTTTTTTTMKKSKSTNQLKRIDNQRILAKKQKNMLQKQLKDSIDARTKLNNSTHDPNRPSLDANGRLIQEEVIKRREISEKVESVEIIQGKVTLEYAYCTQRGYYPDDAHKPNQDAFTILSPFGASAGAGASAGTASMSSSSSSRKYKPTPTHTPTGTSSNHPRTNKDALFAVFDGHGPVGEHFAQYTKTHLPKLLQKHLKKQQVLELKQYNLIQMQKQKEAQNKETDQDTSQAPISISFNPKFFEPLDEEGLEIVSHKAHVECNKDCIETQPLVNLSGTTALSAWFYDGRLLISNVGDSRAILGYRYHDESEVHDNDNDNDTDGDGDGDDKKSKGKLMAVPLTQDQTPWRKDERERIQQCGGRCLTIDEIEGKVNDGNSNSNSENNNHHTKDRKLGEKGDIDIQGDPPRVWKSDENIPGCSFTRSIGDSIADTVGVNGEPETFSKSITLEDEVLVLASDGVFEFLPNQTIMDLCVEKSNNKSNNNPLVACERVVDAAYRKWLEYENRTDDITVLVLFIKHHS